MQNTNKASLPLNATKCILLTPKRLAIFAEVKVLQTLFGAYGRPAVRGTWRCDIISVGKQHRSRFQSQTCFTNYESKPYCDGQANSNQQQTTTTTTTTTTTNNKQTKQAIKQNKPSKNDQTRNRTNKERKTEHKQTTNQNQTN